MMVQEKTPSLPPAGAKGADSSCMCPLLAAAATMREGGREDGEGWGLTYGKRTQKPHRELVGVGREGGKSGDGGKLAWLCGCVVPLRRRRVYVSWLGLCDDAVVLGMDGVVN